MNQDSQNAAPPRDTLLLPVVLTGFGAITARGDFTGSNAAGLAQSTLDGAKPADFTIAGFELRQYLA
ncbi:MAG: hypothetical protein JWN98_872, partial [Abditibacteriota bacterium]|nr:hypothetical protein [Abditibacteriota bacterium]